MSAGEHAGPASRRVEVLAIGDELLAGDTVNGNAAVLGRLLSDAGLRVARCTVVGDDEAVIADAVLTAADRLGPGGALVVTGGLGPTTDDLTREGVARAAGTEVQRDPGLLALLRARYGSVDRAVPERSLRMADLPGGAVPLPNPTGSAPGFSLEVRGLLVLALPGVPGEMRAMAEESVLPALAARFPDRGAVATRVVRTSGVWESDVNDVVAPLAEIAAEQVQVGYYAGGGEVRVKLTARGADPAAVAARADRAAAAVRTALGPAAYEGETLAGAVGLLLEARGETVATAESLTAGLLAAALTERAGASRTVRGGVVAYATELKATLFGLDPAGLARTGAVHPDVARAMAEGVRRRTGADWGVALTGVAGPDPQDGRAPGTLFVGLAGPDGTTVLSRSFPGDRGRVRALAVVTALDALRRRLSDSGGPEEASVGGR